MAVTITWNGDRTGLFIFPYSTQIDLCKISDEYFTPEEFTGYSLFVKEGDELVDGTSISTFSTNTQDGITSSAIIKGGTPAVITYSGDIETPLAFIKKGTYFVYHNVNGEYFTTKLVLPNATREEAETPLATIEYNGNTIAQLNAGDKATIPCSQYNMSKDLVFKVNKVESGGECSGEHIITVDTLPSIGEEGKVYKTIKLLDVGIQGKSAFELYKFVGQKVEGHYVETRPTENIKPNTDGKLYIYYVKSENAVLSYENGEWHTLISEAELPFGGEITDISQATGEAWYIICSEAYSKYYRDWETYFMPLSSTTVEKNGTVDVTEKAKVIVDVPTIIEVTELPTSSEFIDIDSIYSYNGKLYRFNKSLKGIWIWNPTMSTGTMEFDGIVAFPTPFESNGETFSGMQANGSSYLHTISYDNNTVYNGTGVSEGNWTNDNYRTVTFLEDFYTDNVNVLLANGKKTTNLWVEYIVPSGSRTLKITENGKWDEDVTNIKTLAIEVDVESGGDNDLMRQFIDGTLTEFSDDTLETVRAYLFRDFANLVNVNIPNAKSMNLYAFQNCTKLALTSLPNGLTSISAGVFQNCTMLAITSIPSGVKSIGGYAFANCTSLTSITFEGTPPSIAATAFNGCTNLTTINVPWAEGAVANAPWGASNATINYNYTGG